MNLGKELSLRQVVFMLYLARTAAVPFFYTKFTITELGMSAWQFIITDAIYTLLGCFIVLKLMSRHPGENILTIFPKLLGKIAGKGVLLLLALFYLSKCVMLIRGVADVVRLSLLYTTPQWVIALMFLLPVAYAVTFGITPLARVIDLVLLFGFPMIMVSLATLLPNLDFDFMTNLWILRPEAFISTNFLATLPFATNATVLFLTYPSIQATTKDIWKGSIIAIALSTVLLYFPIVYFPQLTFGPEGVLQYRAPLYSAIRVSPVSFYIVENVAIIFYSVWNLVSFAAAGMMFYFAMRIIFELVPFRRGLWLIPFAFVGPLSYISTFQTLTLFLKHLPYTGMLSAFVSVALPAVLYILSKRVGHRGEQYENSTN